VTFKRATTNYGNKSSRKWLKEKGTKLPYVCIMCTRERKTPSSPMAKGEIYQAPPRLKIVTKKSQSSVGQALLDV
jgi:hypothetical protein